MYELIDERLYGFESERPLLLVERWGNTYRKVYSLHARDLEFAREILERMNDVGSHETLA